MTQFGKVKHIHFVGIGGIGMSGLAELLINLGYDVSGSDLRESAVTRRLINLGGTVFKGHERAHVEGVDVVVYSSAIARDNPEIAEAKDRHTPVIPGPRCWRNSCVLNTGSPLPGPTVRPRPLPWWHPS